LVVAQPGWAADGIDASAVVSRPLTTSDVGRYRRIFALQADGRWIEANRLIEELDNLLLLGHVLAQRYLHPTAYRSTSPELTAWLERYADLPQAARIRRMTRADHPQQPVEIGLDEQPAVAADAEPRRSPERWRQAIAAWREGRAEVAAERFGRLAATTGSTVDELAAAAFWAARANRSARRPQHVAPFLHLAARSAAGFYGFLARRMLDGSVDTAWREEQVGGGAFERTLRYPAVQRAVALARVGQLELADAELQRTASNTRPELAEALGAVAVTLGLPSGRWRSAERLPQVDDLRHRDGAPLPLPRWRPAGGYQLDPAFVHAVIRAESGFVATARSAKGAIGLMQVMPGTARLVAKGMGLPYRGERWLMHPPINMLIGQAWLKRLAASKAIGNSLVHLIAAYNAGEGRVADWGEGALRGTDKDPLLYIESVPIDETRGYIKRVLAGYWAYQARSGRPIPSLQTLAESRWPEVEPVVGPVGLAAAKKVTRHARANRRDHPVPAAGDRGPDRLRHALARR
jgi:soluble lytic murein transglycosylase-like protein